MILVVSQPSPEPPNSLRTLEDRATFFDPFIVLQLDDACDGFTSVNRNRCTVSREGHWQHNNSAAVLRLLSEDAARLNSMQDARIGGRTKHE